MKLACFQSNKGLRQLPFRQFVQQAAELGYDAIDIPVNEAGAADYCRSLNLTVNSAGPLFLPDLGKSSERQEEISTKLRSATDDASVQNVPSITLLIGRDVSLNGDENIAIFKDLFTPLAAYAEQKQVRLAFENWPRNGTMLAMTPELWDGMFNAVPSPALGLCYDPSHLYWLGIDYIQPIWDFQDRIYHAHAKDTEILPKGSNRFGIYGRQLSQTQQQDWWRYRLPGYGHVNWARYIDTLYQIGYNSTLSVEHEDPVWSETPELALHGLKLTRQYLSQYL